MNTYFNTAMFIAENIMPFCIEDALLEINYRYKAGAHLENCHFIAKQLETDGRASSFDYVQWSYILEWALDLSTL